MNYLIIALIIETIILIVIWDNKQHYKNKLNSEKELSKDQAGTIDLLNKRIDQLRGKIQDNIQEKLKMQKANTKLQRLLSKSYAENEKTLENIVEKFDFNNKKA